MSNVSPNDLNIIVPPLPDEIHSLICQELGDARDYSSLYRCAVSSPILAEPALRILYALHEHAPVFIQSDEENIRQQGVDFYVKQKQQEEFFRKWTVLWRSIIASSLEKKRTYRSYCRYLRILDFWNLASMLEDLKFTNNIRKAFFAGSLNHLQFIKSYKKRQVIDVVATINAIGETLVPKAYLLEEIMGQLSPGFLTRWIELSPNLQNLVLYKGDALSTGTGSAIAQHCDKFKNLTIYDWLDEFADIKLSKCLLELKPNTLQSFKMISHNYLGPQSFSALGPHKSLKELHLGNLQKEAILHLNTLKDCTEIETLFLEDNFGTVQLEALNNDVFVEVVQWLSSCTKLRDITLKNFFDGPAILAQVVVAPDVHLTKLSVEGYTVRQPKSAAFHTALSEQKSLEALSLKGNGEDTTWQDLDIMVQSLSNLSGLKELTLKEVSDEFEEIHVMTLAQNLPQLEEFHTSGQEFSAGLLDVLADLKNLTSLSIHAVTQFNAEAILNFLYRLNPESQKGFNLSLMASAWDLKESEVEFIQEYMKESLGGRFDFELWREEESNDDEDD